MLLYWLTAVWQQRHRSPLFCPAASLPPLSLANWGFLFSMPALCPCMCECCAFSLCLYVCIWQCLCRSTLCSIALLLICYVALLYASLDYLFIYLFFLLHATGTTTATATTTTITRELVLLSLPCARQSRSRAGNQPTLLLRFKVSVRLALQLRRGGHGSDFEAATARWSLPVVIVVFVVVAVDNIIGVVVVLDTIVVNILSYRNMCLCACVRILRQAFWHSLVDAFLNLICFSCLRSLPLRRRQLRLWLRLRFVYVT